MRGLDKLHPSIRDKAVRLSNLCKANGLPILITDTLRTEKEQNELWGHFNKVTNARYPDSPHCWGVAFDFCKNIKGHEYDDNDGFFERVGQYGKSLGLFWGGDFKSFKDKPHFEISDFSAKKYREKYGTPENFMKEWKE